MSEFESHREDPLREEWQKYPIAMRLQRLEALADSSVRLRAYVFGGVDAIATEFDPETGSMQSLLKEVQGDEPYMPLGAKDVCARYEELLKRGMSSSPETQKEAEHILKALAEIIDGEYSSVLQMAKGAAQEDLREADVLAVTSVPAAARRNLAHLRMTVEGGNYSLDHFAWQLELFRQRLVADGLRFERAHPDARGETADANAPWLALQQFLLLPEHNADRGVEMNVVTRARLLAKIDACDALVDLTEEREE